MTKTVSKTPVRKTPVKKAATGKPAAAKAAAKGTKKPATKRTVKKPATVIKTPTPVDVIAQALLDKKAQGVLSLDLTSLDAAICDHFVIAHADSGTQVLALADNVEKEMYERLQEKPFRIQGKENAFWIIEDYGDVVVHIFQTSWRLFYRLEELWADAKQKNYSEDLK